MSGWSCLRDVIGQQLSHCGYSLYVVGFSSIAFFAVICVSAFERFSVGCFWFWLHLQKKSLNTVISCGKFFRREVAFLRQRHDFSFMLAKDTLVNQVW
jgi:hypothetical protein